MSILREFFAKLGLDVDAQAWAKGTIAVEVLKAGLEKMVEVANEAAHQFVEMVESTAEAGKEIKETAQAAGISTRALQELRGAAEDTGVKSEELDGALFRLSRSLYAANKGSEESAATFARLGVNAGAFGGKIRPADEVLGDIAEKFARMPDGAQKSAVAMEIFGRAGARLIPLLNKGRAGIDELRTSAVVMSDETIEAGEEVIATQVRIARVTKALVYEAIGPLLPKVNELLRQFLAWKKANADLIKGAITKTIGTVIKVLGLLVIGMEKAITVASVLADHWQAVAIAAAAWAAGALLAAASNLGLAASFLGIKAAIATLAEEVIVPALLAGAWIALGVIIFATATEIYGYLTGADNLISRLQKKYDQPLKPNAGWWENFAHLIAVLLDLQGHLAEVKRDLFAVFAVASKLPIVGGSFRAAAQAILESQVHDAEAKKQQAGDGATLPSWLANFKLTPAPVPGLPAIPTWTPPDSSSSGAPMSISYKGGDIIVQQQPGQSAHELGGVIRDVVAQEHARFLREAHASLVPAGG